MLSLQSSALQPAGCPPAVHLLFASVMRMRSREVQRRHLGPYNPMLLLLLLLLLLLSCPTVLKRLSSKKVLQPHSGATISFNPHPEPTGSSTPQLPPPSQHDTPSKQHHHQEHQPKQQQQQLKFEVDLLMLVAGNSRQMGRTVAVCPDALLDDGLLDFTLLSGASLATQVGHTRLRSLGGACQRFCLVRGRGAGRRAHSGG